MTLVGVVGHTRTRWMGTGSKGGWERRDSSEGGNRLEARVGTGFTRRWEQASSKGGNRLQVKVGTGFKRGWEQASSEGGNRLQVRVGTGFK